MSFDCPYLFCPKCKTHHTPYEDILNLRPGKYQYDVQKVAALLSSKDTYEESADMLNEIYRFGISPDTVHNLAGEVASRVEMVEIIPSPDEVRKIVEQISANQHRKPIFVFAADGAMAPIRTEEKGAANCWKEVKGIRGYLLDKKQIVHLFSWHQISDKAELSIGGRVISAIPGAGPYLVEFLRGGKLVGAPTLGRFFALHVAEGVF